MKKIDIHTTAIIGQPIRPLQGMVLSRENPEIKEIVMGEELYIGPYTIIGEGVCFGNKVIVDSFCNIERGVKIGQNTIVVHRATIGGYSIIGTDCVIGGLIGEGTVIGNNCRVFGTVVHKQDDPSQSWDHRAEAEPSVVIHDNSFIGFEAFVAGKIEIGPQAYICAGAVITRSVPTGYIAFGKNEMLHHSKWKGELGRSPIFEGV